MNVEAAIAGFACLVLAVGHAAFGRWILPKMATESFPPTPAGPPMLTRGMVRFTWNMVTLVLSGFAILLLILAWSHGIDLRVLTLRWLAVLWSIAAGISFWNHRRQPRNLVRFPVPFLIAFVAAMCWSAL